MYAIRSYYESLTSRRDDALLFRLLATLREDVPLKEELGDLEWRGAREELKSVCHRYGEDHLPQRISLWRT